jgi:hypothetical protein
MIIFWCCIKLKTDMTKESIPNKDYRSSRRISLQGLQRFTRRKRPPQVLPGLDLRENTRAIERDGTPATLTDKAKEHLHTVPVLMIYGEKAVRHEKEIESAKKRFIWSINNLGINPEQAYEARFIEDKPKDNELVSNALNDQPRELTVLFDPRTNVLDIADRIRPDFWYRGGARMSHTSFELTFDWQAKVTEVSGTFYDPGDSRNRSASEWEEKPMPFSEVSGHATEKRLWHCAGDDLSMVTTGIRSGHTEIVTGNVAA